MNSKTNRRQIADAASTLSRQLALGAPRDGDGEPIDVVITWVTYDDTQQRLVSAYQVIATDGRAVPEPPKSRFNDHGLLRYCVRSIRMFMPWVRTVHIACADYHVDHVQQVFECSDELKIVPHSQFISMDHLPTANSHAIELHLHRIPGLAPRFISFNDDFFILNPLAPQFFFDGPTTRHYAAGWVERNPAVYRSQHARAWSNNINAINTLFELRRDTWPYPQHVPVAVNTEHFRQMLAELPPDLVAQTADARLRSSTDLHTLGLYVIWSHLRKLSRIIQCTPAQHTYVGIAPGLSVPSLLEQFVHHESRPSTVAFNDEAMTEAQSIHLAELVRILLPTSSRSEH